MFGKDNWFYNQSIRRYTILFGSIFDNVYIQRKNQETNEADFIKVPLKFSRGFLYEKLNQDSSARENTRVRQVLPAMAFDLTEITFDPARKHSEFQYLKNTSVDEADNRTWTTNPMPYNFLYTLYIRTKNMDDLFQIIEQIVPPFNTGLTIRAEDLPEDRIKIERDIIINLRDIKWEDNWDGIQKDARVIDAEITFDLDGYIYSQVGNAPVVRETELLGLLTGDFNLTPVEVLFSSTGDVDANEQTVRNLGDQVRELEKNIFDTANKDNIEDKANITQTKKRKTK